ncbi:MAG: rhodanese-like domain-containing protein [Deltaproteobacteria bacterium]|nr:rhodanese-like domain-containing protein [Deltaproteobacteria bacterium]
MYKKLSVYLAVIISIVFYGMGACGAQNGTDVLSITARELKGMMEKGEPLTVIDVRTPEEYNEGHIPGSVSIHRIPEIKKFHYEGKVVLYCTVGVRSKKAMQLFAEKGIKTIDLEDGIKGWIAAGGNVVAGPYKEITEYPESYEIPKGVCETKEPAMKMGK